MAVAIVMRLSQSIGHCAVGAGMCGHPLWSKHRERTLQFQRSSPRHDP
ncbi:hypothetical protein [Aestuariivirga sp.]